MAILAKTCPHCGFRLRTDTPTLTRAQAGLDGAGFAMTVVGLVGSLIASLWSSTVDAERKACELYNRGSVLGHHVCHSNSAPLVVRIVAGALLGVGVLVLIGVRASKRGS